MRHAAWGSAAGLLALAAVRFAVKQSRLRDGRSRVAPHQPLVPASKNAPAAAAPQCTAVDAKRVPSIELVRELQWARYVELCTAYYEEREFRVEPICRDADGSIDAKLYFRRLPEPVAILRYEARAGDDAGLAAMGELCEIMAHNRIGRGLLHSRGRLSAEAVELADLSRIQLVSDDDLMSKLLRLPEDMRRELLERATVEPVTL